MDMNYYDMQSEKTAIYPKIGNNIIYPVLGLVGEAGEVANKVKKVERDQLGVYGDQVTEELAQELGDVLWYVAACARELGYTINDIAIMNLEKLAARAQKGTLKGSGDVR